MDPQFGTAQRLPIPFDDREPGAQRGVGASGVAVREVKQSAGVEGARAQFRGVGAACDRHRAELGTGDLRPPECECDLACDQVAVCCRHRPSGGVQRTSGAATGREQRRAPVAGQPCGAHRNLFGGDAIAGAALPGEGGRRLVRQQSRILDPAVEQRDSGEDQLCLSGVDGQLAPFLLLQRSFGGLPCLGRQPRGEQRVASVHEADRVHGSARRQATVDLVECGEGADHVPAAGRHQPEVLRALCRGTLVTEGEMQLHRSPEVRLRGGQHAAEGLHEPPVVVQDGERRDVPRALQ